MIKNTKPSRLAVMIVALVMVSGLFVANAMAVGPGTVTMTVTAVGKKDTSPPIVTKDDVQLYLNKERTQVADWKHAEKLYLAVLIDDSLDSVIASQWGDLKAFFLGQPDTTYISVAYTRNGAAMFVQDTPVLFRHRLFSRRFLDQARGSRFHRQPRAKTKYQHLDHLCSRCGAQGARILSHFPGAVVS